MISNDIAQAKKLIDHHEIIAIPTDTVYGIATHPDAAKKIFHLKKRPYTKPLILQTDSIKKVLNHIQHFPPQAKKLANTFWPGPLTLVLEKKPTIPNLITAQKNTVGIRIPNHPTTLKLLKQLPYPLVVTSANLSGKPSLQSAQEVEKALGHKIPYILEGSTCSLGIESTIVGFIKNQYTIYRKGHICTKDIQKTLKT